MEKDYCRLNEGSLFLVRGNEGRDGCVREGWRDGKGSFWIEGGGGLVDEEGGCCLRKKGDQVGRERERSDGM